VRQQQPLDCHRCRLIGRALAARGVVVRHILPDGSTTTQADIEAELLRRAGHDAEDLFMPYQERLAAAYRAHARTAVVAASPVSLANG
jgi:hypothetical protein